MNTLSLPPEIRRKVNGSDISIISEIVGVSPQYVRMLLSGSRKASTIKAQSVINGLIRLVRSRERLIQKFERQGHL